MHTETRISVTRPIDGSRLQVVHRATGGPQRPVIRPVLLDTDEHRARVSLVPEGALLLTGDVVELHVDVGVGATVDLSEPAGTVAYDMRGGHATWDVSITLGVGACLVWHGEPFVAAAGSDTRRTTRVTIDYGARLALRESIVLGRHGEPPGRLRHALYACHADGRPVLADGADLGPGRTGIVLGRHRVMETLLLLGADLRDTEPRGTRFDLEAGGTMWRSLTENSHQATDAGGWQAVVKAACRR